MLISEKTTGRFNFFFASKEAYPIVRQLEKITVKKAQAKVVKCAKNKSWVPRNPPWSLKCLYNTKYHHDAYVLYLIYIYYTHQC